MQLIHTIARIKEAATAAGLTFEATPPVRIANESNGPGDWAPESFGPVEEGEDDYTDEAIIRINGTYVLFTKERSIIITYVMGDDQQVTNLLDSVEWAGCDEEDE